MRTEYATELSTEQATVERGTGRPTPKYIEGMRDLLGSLRRNPTSCEACGVSLASIVTGQPPIVICRTCSERYRGPFRRYDLRQAVARRSGR